MALLLFFIFILLPIAELYVIIQVGQWIGVVPTLALLLIDGFAGAWLARHQGRAAWERFNKAMAEGRVPAKEVVDGAMVIFGGALLLAPGFITDIFGLILLIPPTRAVVRGTFKWGASKTTYGRPAVFAYRVGSRFPRGERGSDPAGQPPRSGPSRPPPGADPFGGTGPAAGARPRRDYDLDGTAREINDSESALPDRAGDAGDGENGPRNG